MQIHTCTYVLGRYAHTRTHIHYKMGKVPTVSACLQSVRRGAVLSAARSEAHLKNNLPRLWRTLKDVGVSHTLALQPVCFLSDQLTARGTTQQGNG